MNFSIKGHHVEVTDAMREYVLNKLETVVGHFSNMTSIDITFTVERRCHKAEGCRQKVCARLNIPGNDLYVVASSGDAYRAVDSMFSRLDRQVVRSKEMRKNHRSLYFAHLRKPVPHIRAHSIAGT